MEKVLVHYKELDGCEWINEEVEFSRVPCVGEYIALATSSEYHRVYLVVHTPFSTAWVAEVYSSVQPNAHIEAIEAGCAISIPTFVSDGTAAEDEIFRVGDAVEFKRADGTMLQGEILKIDGAYHYISRSGDPRTYPVFKDALRHR